MSNIELSKDETTRVVDKIKTYFSQELNQEIGGFDAEFLIEFFSRELGAYYYNRGLSDAHTLLLEKTEEIGYLIQELEKPTT